MVKEIKNSLKELGFKSNEVKVYIALTQLGEAPAAKIAKQAELPRTTVISILYKLEAESYLTTHRYRGTTYYWIESPKTLTNILEHKISLANELNGLLGDLYRSESHFPSAVIYDTKSGIRKFIEKILTNLEKKSVIYTIDTPEVGNYSKIYSENVENNIASLKNKRQLLTRTLVPFGSLKTIEPHKLKRQPIEVREMPEGINFKASLWLVDDMAVHFSGNPPFVAAIKHEAIVSGMKSIYDFLWRISK